MDILPMHDFVLFRKFGALGQAGLLKPQSFCPYLIRDDFKYWEAVKLTKTGVKFSKMLQNSNFIIGNKYCQLFSWKKQTHFVYFCENDCQVTDQSVSQFSCSVKSDSLWRHGLWHARLPCLSPSPGVGSNSMSIEMVMPPNHLVLYCPLLFLLSIFPSVRVFSNESTLQLRWPKYWSSSFSLSPSSEHSGLISFRIDWLDLLVV